MIASSGETWCGNCRSVICVWHESVAHRKHSKQCKKAAENFRRRKLICRVCLHCIDAVFL